MANFFVGSNSRTGDWSPSTGSSALAAASVPWMCYFKQQPVEGFSGGNHRGNFSEKHGPSQLEAAGES